MQWFNLGLQSGFQKISSPLNRGRHYQLPNLLSLSRGLLLYCLIWLSSITCIRAQSTSLSPEICPVIPQPLHAKLAADAHPFQLSPFTKITLRGTANNELIPYFRDRLTSFLGKDWRALGQQSGNPATEIVLECTGSSAGNNKSMGHESASMTQINSYQLKIQSASIHIQASTDQGLFYGLNSLLQLALQPRDLSVNAKNKSVVSIACWNIQDQPALAWRGFMLDESRHFFGKEKVKEILDWMAFYKLNSFHWHLTDEPGWRLTINAFPKLTTIGAIGNKTDSTAARKFYTQDDIREIVAYARKRFIQVLPEIDMPGHATAANRAYPEMSGGGTGKFANFTFNPGKNEVYTFLTKILEETAGLFPLHMVHLGGDEVSFGSASWNTNAAVQQLMQKEHLKDIKAVEFYFLRRMADSALKYNRRILAWDEATAAKLPKDKTTVMWWRHDKKKELGMALDAGYSVIFCPRLPLYFDFVQDSTHKVGRRWNKSYAGLRSLFDFWPAAVVPKGISYHPKQIVGLQANLWTEKVESPDRLDFLLFPRIAALATAAWTAPELRVFPDFLVRLKAQLPLFQQAGIYYFDYFDPASNAEPKK